MDEGQNNVSMGGGEAKSGSVGLVIAIIVILVIVILGGLYFWGQRVDEEAATGAVIESINTQSDSDDPSAIETDLDATEIENLDSEINAS